MGSFAQQISNLSYAMMIRTGSDHDECLSDLVICLASDYQKVVMPKERSLARIDNDKQTVHPKHSSLNT